MQVWRGLSVEVLHRKMYAILSSQEIAKTKQLAKVSLRITSSGFY